MRLILLTSLLIKVFFLFNDVDYKKKTFLLMRPMGSQLNVYDIVLYYMLKVCFKRENLKTLYIQGFMRFLYIKSKEVEHTTHK